MSVGLGVLVTNRNFLERIRERGYEDGEGEGIQVRIRRWHGVSEEPGPEPVGLICLIQFVGRSSGCERTERDSG